jgi:hypothetical protein
MFFSGILRLPESGENIGIHTMTDRYGRKWYAYHRSGYVPTAPRQSELSPAKLEGMYSKPPYTLKEKA